MEIHDDFNQKLERVNEQLKTLSETEETPVNTEKAIKSLTEEVTRHKSSDRKYTFYDLRETDMTLNLQQEINEAQYIEKGNS